MRLQQATSSDQESRLVSQKWLARVRGPKTERGQGGGNRSVGLSVTNKSMVETLSPKLP